MNPKELQRLSNAQKQVNPEYKIEEITGCRVFGQTFFTRDEAVMHQLKTEIISGMESILSDCVLADCTLTLDDDELLGKGKLAILQSIGKLAGHIADLQKENNH